MVISTSNKIIDQINWTKRRFKILNDSSYHTTNIRSVLSKDNKTDGLNEDLSNINEIVEHISKEKKSRIKKSTHHY